MILVRIVPEVREDEVRPHPFHGLLDVQDGRPVMRDLRIPIIAPDDVLHSDYAAGPFLLLLPQDGIASELAPGRDIKEDPVPSLRVL